MTPSGGADAPILGLGTWAYDRGCVVPAGESRLPLGTQALHYGTGVFEGIRAFRSDSGLSLFRAHDHFERLLRGCRLLRIAPPGSVDDLVDRTAELLRHNEHCDDTYVRPVAYKLSLLPETPAGVALHGVSDGMSITTHSFPQDGQSRPLCCGISSWRRPSRDALPAQAKITGGYVTAALAGDEARAVGDDDAILLDSAGNVAEATTSNVFAMLCGRLVTPPPTGDLLPGITRDTVLALCRESGLEVLEHPISPAELLTADEIFLTSTGKGVAPVVAVAGRAVGSGAIGETTRRIATHYDAVTRGADGDHRDWLTAVTAVASNLSTEE
ncbi:aminotransferase class IV [Nocardia sp. CA-107356]|uniref:aminotransferase class IV n=1 Tax=Nocardia sp. CA-107356 TaxID=3239972 RepID=UPI003D8F2DDB